MVLSRIRDRYMQLTGIDTSGKEVLVLFRHNFIYPTSAIFEIRNQILIVWLTGW